jgi:hypothetical protein
VDGSSSFSKVKVGQAKWPAEPTMRIRDGEDDVPLLITNGNSRYVKKYGPR